MFKRIKEAREKGFFMPKVMIHNMLKSLGPMIVVILKHPITLIKRNAPAYRKRLKGMKVSRPNLSKGNPFGLDPNDGTGYSPSNERYLRPTRYCEVDSPELVALAKKLGASKKSDREYAETIFEFVKNNIKLEFISLKGGIETLKCGGGVCLSQMSLLIALARIGGIQARYKLYGLAMVQPFYNAILEAEPLASEWYEAIGFMAALHGAAELKIDGKWIALDPTFSEELDVGLGLPIQCFGDAATGWVAVPGDEIILEGLPLGLKSSFTPLLLILLGPLDAINVNLDKIRMGGRKKLEEMGEEGREEYIKEMRKGYTPVLPTFSEIKAFRERGKKG